MTAPQPEGSAISPAPRVASVQMMNWLRLFAMGLIWGSSFIAVEIAIETLPPISVAAGRISLAALLLVPLAFWLGDGLPRLGTPEGRRLWLHALGVAALSNAMPFGLLSWAQGHVTAGLAAIFMSTLPLIVLPLSHLLVPGERMTRRRTVGFLIGFCGVVVLIGPSALGDLGGGAVEMLAQIACMGAVTGYACGSIVTKLAPRTHALSFSAAAMLLASLMIVPMALIFEDPFSADASASSVLAVVYLGVLPTAFAMVLLVKVLETAGPPFLSLVNYQVPVWAMLFGAVLLGERVEPRFGLALALILVGVAISQNLLALLRRR